MGGNETSTLAIDDPVYYEAIVIGAGISGLVTASVLQKQGYKKILVIDEYKKIGGNHIDRSIGTYTFDIGSLIFQDDSPLMTHFPEILSKYVEIKPTWGKITPNKVVTKYPFSFKNDILACGLIGIVKIAISLVYSRLFDRKITNAKEFAKYWMGEYFLEKSGLENYMSRFFGVDASLVDLEFAKKRMLWIERNSSIKYFMRILWRDSNEGPINRQLARPISGFDELYRPAAEKLEKDGAVFKLGQPIASITRDSNNLIVRSGGQTLVANRLISTIPINRTLELASLAIETKLTTVTLISLFYSFDGEREFKESILYNFTHEGAWKRLTMYSDFYGLQNGREYFGLEVISSYVGNDVSLADRDFRNHIDVYGLFRGRLFLEGSEVTENAYPIYINDTRKVYSLAIDRLNNFGIESFGRQGGFNYQPTARASTLDAEDALVYERKL